MKSKRHVTAREFKCEFCGKKGFKNLKTLSNHKSSHYIKKEKIKVCIICGDSFESTNENEFLCSSKCKKQRHDELDEDVDKLYQEEISLIHKGKFKQKLKYPDSFYEHWKKRLEEFILNKLK